MKKQEFVFTDLQVVGAPKSTKTDLTLSIQRDVEMVYLIRVDRITGSPRHHL
jgi:hypothetical protein